MTTARRLQLLRDRFRRGLVGHHGCRTTLLHPAVCQSRQGRGPQRTRPKKSIVYVFHCFNRRLLTYCVKPVFDMTILQELMDNDARVKADALKKIIFAILNGDKFPTLLMDIIRFVIPCSVSCLLTPLFSVFAFTTD